jgi:hypothetical protein
MPRDLEVTTDHSGKPVLFSLLVRNRAGWQGLLLVVAGWVGVGLAHAAEDASGDPRSTGAVLWTAGLALFALAAIGGGAAVAVSASLSPMRYVFRSKPAFWTGVVLIAFAGAAIFGLIQVAPFDGILAHGMPPAELITVLTVIAAAATCLVAGVIALSGAWDARRKQSRWY